MPGFTPPPITADEALVEDLDTGQVLFAKQPNHRRPIASLTKLMTALLVLRHDPPGAGVTMNDRVAKQPLSSLQLKVGERVGVRALLYAALLQSSNDAAVALAQFTDATLHGGGGGGGSVERFVGTMNSTAAAMGLRDTRFASPNGLDDDGYSTARDLAVLARTDFALPMFARIVRTKSYDVHTSTGPVRHVQNRNVLLWLYPGDIGGKTGFTTPAGHCLVTAAQRDGRRVLVVVLGERETAFDDGAALLNFGFTGFRRQTLFARGDRVGSLHLATGRTDVLAAGSITKDVGANATVTVEFEPAPQARTLPIRAGERVGHVVATANGTVLATAPAIAATELPLPLPPPVPPSPIDRDGPFGAVLRVLVAVARSVLGPFLY